VEADAATSSRGIVGWVGLIAGPALALLAYCLIPQAVYDDAGKLVSGLPHAGRATAAVGVLMACWWLTEAIHISATALVPVALLPLLGVMSVKQAAAPYANHLIFLFFGGFIIGLAMEKWGLHKRVALLTIRLVGTSPARLVAGFMLASALMSMWVSNTATTLMMLPVGVSVLTLLAGDRGGQHARFAVCLMLSIAYGASIGGVGTLVGTPPNGILASFCDETLKIKIDMSHWMLAAVPLVAVFLPIAWLLLTRVLFPIKGLRLEGAREHVREQLRALGSMNRGEWVVSVVFILTASAWITRPLINDLGDVLTERGYEIPGGALASLEDASIALAAALALFVIPVSIRPREFAMDWATTRRTPWGVLILFGGGLSLAHAITETGVDTWIGSHMHALAGAPPVLIVLVVVTAMVFLTEITSNTAVTTAILPVLAAAAPALGIDPLRLLVPAAVAASFAFMLPVATPPNAIVFSSGRVTIREMARAGFVLNLVGIVLLMLFAPLFARVLT